jgi:hypothetical protein
MRNEIIDGFCTDYAFLLEQINHVCVESDAICQDVLGQDENEGNGWPQLINGQTRKELVERLTILEEYRTQLVLLDREVRSMVDELNSHMT